MNNRRRFVGVVLACAIGACSPDEQDGIKGVGNLQGDGDGDADHDRDATHSDDAKGALDPEPLAYAVVLGDYAATSVGLLEADGSILSKSFIHSGSATAGLVTALSGDVILPTRSGDSGVLTLLDRFRTDVLTRVDPASGKVLGQLKTHVPNDDDDEAAYSSNPQDYVYFGARDAWVSRFAPNENVDDDDPDRGLDLLHIDPTDLERGDRISFWPLNGKAERENPDTGKTEMVTVYARPSSIVRLGELLVVGVASLSATFDAAGEGMVALVDPEARTIDSLELPNLKNCGTVVPVPDDATRVVVACVGHYQGTPRDSAGLVVVRLVDDTLEIEHMWRARDDPDAPPAVESVVALGGTRVIATAAGAPAVTDAEGNETSPGTADAIYVLDIARGAQELLFRADGRYKIGGGAYDARSGLLLVPDASTDADGRPKAGVRTFERQDDGSFEPGQVIELDDVLPPKQVRAL